MAFFPQGAPTAVQDLDVEHLGFPSRLRAVFVQVRQAFHGIQGIGVSLPEHAAQAVQAPAQERFGFGLAALVIQSVAE